MPFETPALPAITIAAIIPLYNGATFIERAIQSIFAQTLQADEIIVVDDGSRDEGLAIVERLPQANRITVLRKENGGQSSARNLGVKSSKSSLIAFLDQDDIWYSRHLEKLADHFRKADVTPPLGWVYSNLDEVDARGLLISRRILDATPISHPKLRLVDCLAEDMYILPSASLISREAFDAVGGFDERLAGYEDDDLFLRMFRAGYQNIYVDEPLSQWRIHFSSSSYARKMSESRLIYFEKLCTEYPDDPDRDYFYVKNLIAPRFCRSLLGEYSRAIRTGSEERFSSAVRDLRIVSRRLRFKAAMIFAAILFLSRSTRAGANILMLSRLFGRLGFRTRLIS